MSYKLKILSIVIFSLLTSSCYSESSKSKDDVIFQKTLNLQLKNIQKQNPLVEKRISEYIGGFQDRKKLALEYCQSFRKGKYKKGIKSNWKKVNALKQTKKIKSQTVKDIFYGHKGIAEAGIFSYCPEYIDKNTDRHEIFLSYIFHSRNINEYGDNTDNKRRNRLRTRRNIRRRRSR